MRKSEQLITRLKHHVKKSIPILQWLPNYKFKEDIINDIVGGLTVGIMLVPQGNAFHLTSNATILGMAYASLANLKPVNGLYTSFFAPLIYMIFGTSRHVALGVFAVVSLMSGSCNVRVTEEIWEARNGSYESLLDDDASDKYDISLQVSMGLTLFTGIIQIAMALLRLDSLVSLLSDQVITGFTTGASVHVFVAQLNKVIGVKLPRHSGPGKLFLTIRDLINAFTAGYANYVTIGISAFTIAMLFAAKELVDPQIKKLTKLPVPYDLFVMIAGTILSSVINLNEKYGVKIIGDIPTGLPSPSLPDVKLFHYYIKDAFAVAVVSLVVTISMGKLFAKKHNYEIDSRQEFYAVGLTETLSSFFPVWPSATGLARTLVYEAAGTKSQLAALFSCGLLLAVILFIAPLVEALPTCLLSCIIIVALKGMLMQVSTIPSIWRVSKLDALVFIITMVATVVLDVVEGLMTGIVFAALLVLYKSQRSSVTTTSFHTEYIPKMEPEDVMEKLELQINNPLFYMNIEKIKKEIDTLIKSEMRCLKQAEGDAEICLPPKESYVIIDLSKMNFIDFSGVSCLFEIVKEYKEKDITVTFTKAPTGILDVLKRHSSYNEDLFSDSEE